MLGQIKSFRVQKPTSKFKKNAGTVEYIECPSCKSNINKKNLIENLHVCPHCNYYLSMRGQDRFKYLLDEGFNEVSFDSKKFNPINYPEYEKIRKRNEKEYIKEAISIAKGKIISHEIYLAVLESEYMMGSLGTYMGSELYALFDRARIEKLPVIVILSSGGARMQEGIFSLMQMAKVAQAVQRFKDAGLLYISMLANPATGGVMASFASQGDITIAEPKALIGFAGPRVIEQTIHQKLPDGFQRSEKLAECGFIDVIATRREQRSLFYTLLKIHDRRGIL
ncbi:Acetyl-coenzyme A carboxylase carboxyl transferase subunits beta/alpha [Peptoniphilus sp. ING2-D1G]|nr:Acetyl-coenzyme A carboxylase carboxyl transferase subunits beta/alpha [Peptoniphilus sp. ING2-D1G]